MWGDSSNETGLSEEEKLYALNEKPLWQRSAIAFAGPAANLLFSFLVFFVLFSARGVMSPMPIVGGVLEGSTAARIGLEAGDRIVNINGNEVVWFEEIRHYIVSAQDDYVSIGFDRLGNYHRVTLGPGDWSDGSRRLGISASVSPENVKIRRLPVLKACGEAYGYVYRIVKITLMAVVQLITGSRSVDELGGPVRIAKHSGEAIRNKEGLRFVGLISANLGVINLLPLPMLDGGFVLQYILQGIFRRKTLNPKHCSVVMAIGFVLLVSLMVFVTFNDVKSILR